MASHSIPFPGKRTAPLAGRPERSSEHLQSLRRFTDRLMQRVFVLCGFFAVAAVLGIAFYLISTGLPAIREIGPVRFLFGTRWEPSAPDPAFGILPMILSSLAGTALSLLLALPIGLMTAVFLTFAPRSLSRLMNPAVELMAGIPSVIYGLVGSVLLTPQVAKLEKLLFPPGRSSHTFTGGANLISAVVVLAVMILPTIIRACQLSLCSVPGTLREASLALGAGEAQTIFRAVIPAAKGGILSGAVLGIGRAMGEAMAVMMVCGNTVHIPLPFQSVRLLAGEIATEMSYSSGLHRKALFSIGLILFVLLLFLNLFLETALKQRN